jgi:hypothetical protein
MRSDSACVLGIFRIEKRASSTVLGIWAFTKQKYLRIFQSVANLVNILYKRNYDEHKKKRCRNSGNSDSMHPVNIQIQYVG